MAAKTSKIIVTFQVDLKAKKHDKRFNQHKVDTVLQAQRLVDALASEYSPEVFQGAMLTRGKERIGRISYNGRVWEPGEVFVACGRGVVYRPRRELAIA